MAKLVVSARFAVTPDELFAFHSDARNLEQLSHGLGKFRLLDAPQPTRRGDLQRFRLGPRPFARRWHARIVAFDSGHSLTDVQEVGPFARWRHSHVVFSDGAGAVLIDHVEFALGRNAFTRLIDRLLIAPLLRRAFADRHRRTRALLEHER